MSGFFSYVFPNNPPADKVDRVKDILRQYGPIGLASIEGYCNFGILQTTRIMKALIDRGEVVKVGGEKYKLKDGL